jgi:hypothetical protein
MPRIAQDRLCLCCEKRPIIGKPYSVYVCRECYLHGSLDDNYDTCRHPVYSDGDR